MEAIYEPDGKIFWKGFYIDHPRKPNIPENLKGRMLLFSDRVVYQRNEEGLLCLKVAPIRSNHTLEDLDIDSSMAKAVLDENGKPIWENPDHNQEYLR